MNANLKILFCEQNPRVIQGCQHFFADKSVQVQFCEKDGNILLKKIEEYTPDVVFTDVFLAGIDAIAVKEKSDELENKPKLFFATCTFDSDDTVRQVM